MYSAGVTGHDVTPFISFFWRRHLFFAKVKLVKQIGNVNFSEDYKSENKKKKK